MIMLTYRRVWNFRPRGTEFSVQSRNLSQSRVNDEILVLTVDGPTRRPGKSSNIKLVTTSPRTVSPRCSYLEQKRKEAQQTHKHNAPDEEKMGTAVK